MIILGIETSCDETAAAIVKREQNSQQVQLLAHEVASSILKHRKTGGIIPEAASREQIKYILPVIDSVLKKISPNEIDSVAVTVGPGLIGSLLVGIETAKTLAYVWNKPIIPVNHLVGHIYANWLITNNQQPTTILFPALALVVSGGHTDMVFMKRHGSFKVLGATRDDAAGEAFDKIGRLLGLPYPAGPTIEKLAKKGNPKAFLFPRPMLDSNDYDFSFSGLKTAVLRETKTNKQIATVILSEAKNLSRHPRTNEDQILDQVENDDGSFVDTQDDNIINNLCASVQQAVADVLVKKTIKAAKQYNVKSILLGGGVAANQKLRDIFMLITNNQLPMTRLFAPEKSLCTDNAAMIAAAAAFNYHPKPWQSITADPELYFS